MKTLFYLFVLSFTSITGFAQSNNPYNQRGLDYVSSLDIIANDFNNGKVKEFNEETIAYYSASLPLRGQASTEMAASIFKTLKTPDFSISKFIDESKFSETGKSVCRDIFFGEKGMSEEAYKERLVSKVDDLNKAELDEAEKETLLSVIAIVYHTQPATQATQRLSCHAALGDLTTPMSCIAVGAAMGGFLGYTICGPACGIGGAIIGGVVGAICN